MKITADKILEILNSMEMDEKCKDESCERCQAILPWTTDPRLLAYLEASMLRNILGITSAYNELATIIGNGIMIGIKLAESAKLEELLSMKE